MLALIEVLGAEDASIGTPGVLDMLDPTCGSLLESQQAIVRDAAAAGLSQASIDLLGSDSEVSEMIDDLYNSTLLGR